MEAAEDPPEEEQEEDDAEGEESAAGGMAVQASSGSQEREGGPAAEGAAGTAWAAEQSVVDEFEGSGLEEDLSSRLGQRLGGQLLGLQPTQQQQQQEQRGLHHHSDNPNPNLTQPAPLQQLEQDDPLPGAAAAAAAAKGAKKKGQSGKGKSEKASAAAAARALTACIVCSKAANRTWAVCPGCGKRSHVECLARSLLEVRENKRYHTEHPFHAALANAAKPTHSCTTCHPQHNHTCYRPGTPAQLTVNLHYLPRQHMLVALLECNILRLLTAGCRCWPSKEMGGEGGGRVFVLWLQLK